MVVDGTGPNTGWRDRLAFPAIWLAGGLVILILSRLSVPISAPPVGAADTYYVVAHAHYVVSVAAAFAIFAIAYFVINTTVEGGFRRLLRWGHFALMLLGASLIVAPSIFLRLNAMPDRYADPERALAMWSGASTVGYVLTLVSLFLFVGLLAATLVQRLRRKG